ncbi:hypothetical protein IWQ62_005719 [Dispira parvispora]|uniref:Uncharacterized protein n=1 Tax=Dispira parvispora TaxID=1520584 RepID=A0A9W8DZC4_9FUNG|nr:hypothetical protein IWQ62_005719 [Dispira parvispora]
MVTGGMVSPGVQGSTGLVFAEYWTNIWFHLGVVYTLGVVIAVCIKVFKSQRNVGRFNQGLSNKNMSPTLLRNTRLIMAYPAVLLVIYVPYIMSMWFGTYLQGLFVYYWVMAINVVYNMQGVFSFIIFLFHPVMLSTYNKHNISIGLVWTKVTRRLHLTGSSSTGFSGSTLQGGGSHQRGNHFAGETEVAPVDSTLPHLKSLDMGPGVTNLFNGVEKDDRTYTSTFQSMKSGFISPEISAVHDGDLENQVLLSEFNDPACL